MCTYSTLYYVLDDNELAEAHEYIKVGGHMAKEDETVSSNTAVSGAVRLRKPNPKFKITDSNIPRKKSKFVSVLLYKFSLSSLPPSTLHTVYFSG